MCKPFMKILLTKQLVFQLQLIVDHFKISIFYKLITNLRWDIHIFSKRVYYLLELKNKSRKYFN